MSYRSIQSEFRVRHNRAVGVFLAWFGAVAVACTPAAIPEQDVPFDVEGTLHVSRDRLASAIDAATVAIDAAQRQQVNARIDELNSLTSEIAAWTHDGFELVPSTRVLAQHHGQSGLDHANATHLDELHSLVTSFRLLDSSPHWLGSAPRDWLLATSELLDLAEVWLVGEQVDTSYIAFVAAYNAWSAATQSLARASGSAPAATWLTRAAVYSTTDLASHDWASDCTPLACCVIARSRAESARVHKERSSLSPLDPGTLALDRLFLSAESCLVHVCSIGAPAATCEPG